MDLQLSDDQRALRSGMRELLGAVFDRETLRAAVERGGTVDRGLWRELGAAGLFALRLPEEAGGVGLGLPEAVLLFEEAGRALLPGPLVATHLAAGAVEGAAEGEAVVTALEGGGRPVPYLADADAVLVGPGVLTDPAAPTGSGLLTVPAAPTGSGLLTVPAAPTGSGLRAGSGALTGEALAAFVAEAVPVRSLDPLTPLHRVEELAAAAPGLAGGPEAYRAEGLAGAGAGLAGGSEAYPGALCREGALLTAAEQLGSATRTTEMAVQHARTRKQFGSPIGSFQAVQHLCADMLARTEPARGALYAAALTADPVEIAAAKLLADEAAVRNARDCLQIHGGMGFTWEADVHLHLKRAWLRASRWLTAAESEEILAAALGPSSGPVPPLYSGSAASGRRVAGPGEAEGGG
ncbi:acyl-CoA dehydrogenase [Streptomyces sp. SID8356]|uniref:acyl-CoA dehydrogenase family protein n=1 Tax=unclassified Streptomyces TaxID=2593676 RepID=UPI000365B118|nr:MULTISPECIES: acyl-CoA dehydrogenase family protein [unclassified Streptomyces]MYT40166.1 acyl-CoA dehydrogenase [Streptomyces sp. SID8356]